MTNYALHAIAAVLTVGSHRLRQFCHLVYIFADISVDVPREAVCKAMTIAEGQLPTVVLHLTGVNPLTGTFTHGSDALHEEQNVGGLLAVPVETSVDIVSQQCEVYTNIVLCSGLPLYVIVATLVAHITVCQIIATVQTGNIITGASLTATPQTSRHY